MNPIFSSKLIVKPFVFIFIVLVFTFQSCKKEEIAQNSLKGKLKIEKILGGGGGEYYFGYNPDHQVSIFAQSFQGRRISQELPKYKDGFLTEVAVATLGSSDQIFNLFLTKLYSYENNNVSEIKEVLKGQVVSNGYTPMNYEFEYDSENKLKSLKQEHAILGEKELLRELFIQTDTRGNIIKLTTKAYSDGVLIGTIEGEYEYDDKVNPKYKLYDPAQILEYFSPNNWIKYKVTQTSGPEIKISRSFEYNSANLPVKIYSDVSGTMKLSNEYEYY
ncbi:hypothetical protein [Pedobacter frigoris]|uniref:hypothetical protein n=1 Tax=Pedobacter frigoris TaxID=2571272 RepID=UPI002930E92F|nr:hypothetical protein [Pedobacter frigoris]